MSFILRNLSTITICIVVIVTCVLAIKQLIKDKKNHKYCSGNCSTCGHKCK